ncbi:MAG: asparagine synthetase B, partial [Pseudomonadales bacterium]
MCGIAGFVADDPSAPVAQDLLKRMVGRLRDRGPDGEGYHAEPGVGLGHARLSIIDIETGAQPLANEDRSVWVSFNGEIFNYVELRRLLEDRGHQFSTRSDTEVIVHLYEEYGDEFAHQLNGQFAIALWDRKRRRLLLVRDRPGILPLYFARGKNG